jgi:hypothetical protein
MAEEEWSLRSERGIAGEEAAEEMDMGSRERPVALLRSAIIASTTVLSLVLRV